MKNHWRKCFNLNLDLCEPFDFMEKSDAVVWHSDTAVDFVASYCKDRDKKERYQIWTNLIGQYSHKEFNVIDFGCGNGIFSFYAATFNKKVYGIDASDRMISLCEAEKAKKKIQNICFIHARIESLPQLPINKADLIICSSVLEYLNNPSGFLEIMLRFLKESGFILISVPNRSSLYRKMEPFLFRFTGRPRYYAYVRNVMTLKAMILQLKKYGIKTLGYHFYGQTRFLSPLLRRVRFRQYSDNLFVIMGKKMIA